MPSLVGLTPGWAPVETAARLDPDADWVPEDWKMLGTEVAVAPVGSPDVAVLVGRPGGPAMRQSEVARLAHLAGLAAAVTGKPTDRS